MVNKNMIWFVLFFCVFNVASADFQFAEIRGCIKAEAVAAEKMPQFRVLFAGKETMSNQEGFFSIPLDESVKQYSLLICKNIKQNFVKTNTIRNVCMAPDDNYRYYEFEKTSYGKGWRQQEKRLALERPIAPENCVIVLIDPSFVSRLEPSRLDLGHKTIKMPEIVLKSEVTSTTLAAASARSLLCSLDEKPFHETVKEEVKQLAQNTNVRVSLTR
jgi:hypothetical protein